LLNHLAPRLHGAGQGAAAQVRVRVECDVERRADPLVPEVSGRGGGPPGRRFAPSSTQLVCRLPESSARLDAPLCAHASRGKDGLQGDQTISPIMHSNYKLGSLERTVYEKNENSSKTTTRRKVPLRSTVSEVTMSARVRRKRNQMSNLTRRCADGVRLVLSYDAIYAREFVGKSRPKIAILKKLRWSKAGRPAAEANVFSASSGSFCFHWKHSFPFSKQSQFRSVETSGASAHRNRGRRQLVPERDQRRVEEQPGIVGKTVSAVRNHQKMRADRRQIVSAVVGPHDLCVVVKMGVSGWSFPKASSPWTSSRTSWRTSRRPAGRACRIP